MIPLAPNVVVTIGINTILMKLNFPLMELAITILIAVVKIVKIIGGNIMNLSMLLRRSGINSAFLHPLQIFDFLVRLYFNIIKQ